MQTQFQKGIERFQHLQQLGDGTYGCVYSAIDTTSGGLVALKKVKQGVSEEGIPSTSLREIAILYELQHPNVIKLRDVISSNKDLYLVLEILEKDLRKEIDQLVLGQVLDSQKVKSYMFQLLSGVSFMHSKRIMHRDLKPQNLLVNSEGALKIADFGLARAFQIPLRPYTHEIATL